MINNLQELLSAAQSTGPAVLWLLFISWCVHDVEELLFFMRSDLKNDPRIKQLTDKNALVGKMFRNAAGSQAEINISISFMAVLMLAATLAGWFDPHGAGMLVYGAMLGGYFLHTFTHVGGSLILRRYTPGVITAILVVLPASIIIYTNIFNLGLLDWQQAAWTSLAGIAVFIPLLFIVHSAAAVLAKRLHER